MTTRSRPPPIGWASPWCSRASGNSVTEPRTDMTDLLAPTRLESRLEPAPGPLGRLGEWLRGPDDGTRPPYGIAALVSLAALVLYVATLAPTTQFWDTSEYIAAAYSLAPTTQFWDTSEYIAAAYVLGVPHPPGNPLFVLVAHAWGLLPLAAGYAQRINLLAAVTSAFAAGFWFLVGERWLRPIVPAVWPRRLAALAGAGCSPAAVPVGDQSVVDEKGDTPSPLSIPPLLWVARG